MSPLETTRRFLSHPLVLTIAALAVLAALTPLAGCASPLPSSRVDASGVANTNSLQSGVAIVDPVTDELGNVVRPGGWTFSESSAIRRSVADVSEDGATVTGPDSTFAFEFGARRRLVATTDVTADKVTLYDDGGNKLAELGGFSSSASSTNASAAALFATVRDAYNALTPVMQQQLVRDLEAIKVISPTVGAAVDAVVKALTGGL